MKSNSKLPIFPAAYKVGDEISFSAIRITLGNPVTGTLLKETRDSITVKLTKRIEGVSTTWERGATRDFDKSLIGRISKKDRIC